jgi:hypothetical protein
MGLRPTVQRGAVGQGIKMNETKVLFLFLSFFGVFAGLGVLFVTTNRDEAEKLSKIIPGAGLYQYKWFRYLVAFTFFIIAVIAGYHAFFE